MLGLDVFKLKPEYLMLQPAELKLTGVLFFFFDSDMFACGPQRCSLGSDVGSGGTFVGSL